MKAAVIGCGRMGAFTSDSVRLFSPECWLPLAHAEAIVAEPDLELVALCDANADNLAKARTAYDGVAGFGDHQVLADAVQLDLVGIATRTPGRADIIRTLFERGTRAFHIEKPLCNSVAELEVLTPILKRDDVFATYGTVRRFLHIYEKGRELAESGRFGPLVEVRANFGAGALYWTQPHAIDLILFAARGRAVTGVQARFDRLDEGETPGEVVNDPVLQSATIWFEDGVAGHIGRAPGLDLVMSCESGEITVASDGRRLLVAEQQGDDPYLVRGPYEGDIGGSGPQGTQAPIAQLAACLRGDAEAIAANRVVKRDILLGQRLAFAMIASHRKASRIVGADEIGRDLRILARTGRFSA